MSARTWTLTFPAPSKMHTTNTAKHWAVSSGAKSDFREATFMWARKAKLPRGLDRIRVQIELRFPEWADRESTNYHPLVGKPCVDALAMPRRYQIIKGRRKGLWVVEPGYGLIVDDNPKRHLHCEDCPHIRISDALGPAPFGELVLTITDISEEASNAQ